MSRGIEQGNQDPREAGKQFVLETDITPEIIYKPIDLIASDALSKIAKFREGMKSTGADISQSSIHSIQNAINNARLLTAITPFVSEFFTIARDADLYWEGSGADGAPRFLRFGYSDGQVFGKNASDSGQVGLWFQRRTYPAQYIPATPEWVISHGDDPYKKSTTRSFGLYGQAITLNKLEATIRPYSKKR